jgi:hypothetical protein
VNKTKWGGWIVGIVLIGGAAAVWLSPNYDDAQATTDRQTVNCMVSQLTPSDKQQLAHFADTNDSDAQWHVYDQVFEDCAVRGDQRERKRELVESAWRVLSSDRDFMLLRESQAAHASTRQ